MLLKSSVLGAAWLPRWVVLAIVVVACGSAPATDVIIELEPDPAIDVSGARTPGPGPAAPAFPLNVGVDTATGILMATIDQPGNPDDVWDLGAVAYPYRIAVYEVTNPQFVEFLNAVAADDPNGLYAEIMTDSDRGGILRSGSPGSYSYSIKPNFHNKPAIGMSWYDSARFCNWLHNGKPTGAQGPITTEDGVYDMSLSGDLIVRKGGALYFIPNHDEWYKAAYYDPFDPAADGNDSPDYWLYPTKTDALLPEAQANAVGDVTNPGPHVANTHKGADWNDENGNVTTVGGCMALQQWGLSDLAGNVNEQTETLGTPIPPNPPEQPDALPTRRIRGGDFSNSTALAASPPGLSGSLNMLAEAANIGFRIAARFCVSAPDPPNLRVDREAGDLVLTWDDPGSTPTWNVYRETTPDPGDWGAPHAVGIIDEDPVADGIQFRDVGAVSAGSPLFFKVTGVNFCAESPLD